MPMKNRSLFFAIALCLTVVGCSKNKTNPSKIWYAYSTENLISDWVYFDGEEENEMYAKRDSTLRFSCMKNENEGVQLMITPSRNINSFDFELPDVSGNSGTITKDHFSVSVAYYMNVDFSNERTANSGYYPDALIPLYNYKFRRMNYIDKGRSQALYINLKTDKNTPSGEFKGTGKLHLDNEVIDVPFEVKVFNATLPDEVHQVSSFGIWYDQIVNGEKGNSGEQMNMNYYNFLVEKRVTPKELPPELTNTFDSFIDNYVEKVVRNEKITSHCLPITLYNCSQTNVNLLLQKMITKNIELINAGEESINLFKKAYFYIDDEPTAATFDEVRTHDKIIFEAKKTLSNQLDSWPEIKYSFTHIPNIVTREYQEEMVATEENGGIECWCPQMQYFQTPESRELYRARQNSTDREYGEHVWWYTCIDPVSPYPNYHLDANMMYSRVLRYMQYDYQIDGMLFWNVCYYSKYSRGFTLPRDLWNDPISWELCASDGVLVYPGYNFGINGPITTLRLESILASNEEYEYLWMIEQKVNEYNAIHGESYVANTLLNKYYSRLFTNMVAELDVENFEEVRLELLSLIETLYRDIDAGMALLTK